MRFYFLYRSMIHRRCKRDMRGVVAQWERCVKVIYRDEVVKSNVVKSGPRTRQEDR
jgi:hypothetical protein